MVVNGSLSKTAVNGIGRRPLAGVRARRRRAHRRDAAVPHRAVRGPARGDAGRRRDRRRGRARRHRRAARLLPPVHPAPRAHLRPRRPSRLHRRRGRDARRAACSTPCPGWSSASSCRCCSCCTGVAGRTSPSSAASPGRADQFGDVDRHPENAVDARRRRAARRVRAVLRQRRRRARGRSSAHAARPGTAASSSTPRRSRSSTSPPCGCSTSWPTTSRRDGQQLVIAHDLGQVGDLLAPSGTGQPVACTRRSTRRSPRSATRRRRRRSAERGRLLRARRDRRADRRPATAAAARRPAGAGATLLDAPRRLVPHGLGRRQGLPRRRRGPDPRRRAVAVPHRRPRGDATTAFAAFVDATGHVTEAERFGWSFVFAGFLPDDFPPTRAVASAPWWRQVDGADWRHPEGPQSDLDGRGDHPVVHVSWDDAVGVLRVAGHAPADRGRVGVRRARRSAGPTFPWGDDLEPGGRHAMNVFQGPFPAHEHARRRLRRHGARRRLRAQRVRAATT